MKVCIVGPSKRFFSGISAYTVVMANAFSEQGHKVSVIQFRNLVPLFLYPGRDRVGKVNSVINLNPTIEAYEVMDWNSPLSWLKACYFLKQQNPDVIIIHWWTSTVVHMQLLLAIGKNMGKKKPRLILEMHEVTDPLEEKICPIRLYSRIVGKILINRCDLLTAHSEDARQSIIKNFKVSQKKIYIIPHGPYNIYGVSNKDSSKKEMSLEGYVILFFGMIRQYKGVSFLIEAFNRLPENIANNIYLVIVGENWGDDLELLPSINRSHYRNRIVFNPTFIPDEFVPKYFASSDVVVLPYLRTCGSGVINIAIAQGKPVIVSDLATMRECLLGYSGASFFPTGDVDALRDLILESYENWQNGLVTDCHHVESSWNCITRKYEKIFQKSN